MVVDNRAGGGGNIAVEIVAKSPPDGYTLLMGANGTNAINPNLYPNLPVKPARDLAPISMVASSPMILVAHPSVAAASIKDLVALAKSKPGAINFASSGSGSTAHLSSELFKSMTGIDIVHVPYKGAGPALTDLVGGQVQIMFTGVSSTLPYVKSGRLKALGVSSEKRLRDTARRADRGRRHPRLRSHDLVRRVCARENAATDHRQAQPDAGREYSRRPMRASGSQRWAPSRSRCRPINSQPPCARSSRSGRR